MDSRERCEGAFTLIELLAVLAVIGIMLQLSLLMYGQYRQRAYNATADHMLHNAHAAVEAGRADGYLTKPPGYRFLSLTQPGPLTTVANKSLLPGFVNAKNMVVWVERDGRCEMGLLGEDCITEWLDAVHCKGTLWKSWVRFRSGVEYHYEWVFNGGWPCPA